MSDSRKIADFCGCVGVLVRRIRHKEGGRGELGILKGSTPLMAIKYTSTLRLGQSCWVAGVQCWSAPRVWDGGWSEDTQHSTRRCQGHGQSPASHFPWHQKMPRLAALEKRVKRWQGGLCGALGAGGADKVCVWLASLLHLPGADWVRVLVTLLF